MEKNGDDIMVTVKWAQNILKFLNWVKRRGTTAKRNESSIALRADLLLLESKNSKIIFKHWILIDLILNFDQSPLALTVSNKEPLLIRTVSMYLSLKCL